MAAFERAYLVSHKRCGSKALAPRKACQLLLNDVQYMHNMTSMSDVLVH